MSFTVTLPDGFEYVGVALLSSAYLLVYQALTVGKYRKRAGVDYPQAYAEKDEQEKSLKAMQFNCAQRAHQNTLEYLPVVYMTTIITGLKYPHLAASICGMFIIGRVSYTRGYITGGPSKRRSFLSSIATYGLMGQLLVATYVAAGMTFPKLMTKFCR